MSCLDNTDILRIVGGNSFQIAITVKARRVSDGSEIEDFDLSASSPVLNLIHAGEKTRKYFVTQGNQAIISFDGSEGLGYYGMEMSGSYDSEAWRFCIEKVLQLVDTNAKANIPEWSVLVDDTYFIEGTISIYGGGGGGDTVQADWTETNPTSAAFILHKPDLSVYATKAEVASGLAGKQDTIVDLTSIRYGAAAGATAYQKPSSGIPESDMSEGVQTSLGKADSSYQKPSSGIPSTDMSEGVQAALEKANSAVQTETDPVFSNSPAAEISQNDINSWNAKQSAIADLADIREGAAAGATAVQPDEMAQAIDGVEGDIEDINAKIPTAASSLNQLADKAYVNSSIATNSATYRGSFNLITDLGMNVDATHAQIAGALATAIVTADNNDYAFVQIPDSASTPTVIAKIERYKHNGTGWVYEYDLNNSGFTAAQWAAINSGITSGLVGKLADLPNNSELATLLNGKQNVINDLPAIREGAAAGATAIQPSDLTDALNGVEEEIAGLDESKQDVIEDLSTIRSGAAAGATAYQKPVSGIPESDMSEGVQSALDKADSAYQKPSSGIPATDMSESVQSALDKANSAVQTETDPVFSNSPAADITQADINTWNAKQPAIVDLSDIRAGAAAGATAVQPDEMAQAIDVVDGEIDGINAKIPAAASSLNQLADKAYVNSSISTNSATYRGSFNLITDLGMNVDATHAQIAGALAAAIVTADNNDYAFVQIPDSASTPTVIAKIERYKHNGSGWVYEYDLNNSGFTSAQWAAINSGITSGLVGKLADLPNNSELATLLNGKQNVINDLSAIRSGASAGATAVQPADLTEALNGVEAEIAGLDESKQDTIEDLSTIRSGAAAGATAYQKPASGIPESDMSEGVQTSLGKADSSYQKPSSGIPSTDMSEGVQAALEKANSAVQTETDPVFSNSPAADITQADINTWNAKQSAIADLSDIRAGAAAGATAVQPDEMAQAIDVVDGEIDGINAKIPAAASSLNQLADKAYVNSSISTNSATYRGNYNLVTDLGMSIDATHTQIAGALATAIVTADNNDYAFVQIPDSASTPTVIAKIERYKHNGTGWVYEYDLNNSGFTAAQWAAINSGITSGLVGKLTDLPNNSELATLLNGKQNVINDLPAIREGAAAGATAYQKPANGIPASDMSSTVQQDLSKANTAVQTETDPIFSASPAAGITAQNIQTWNGEPAARQAADTALQTAIQNEATARATADALLQQQYNALTQSDIIVGALPATGVPNVIYRVPGTTDFTDYMWYDNQFVPMATYGLPISAEFVVDENLNKTQEEVNEEVFAFQTEVDEIGYLTGKNLLDVSLAVNGFIDTANGRLTTSYSYPDAKCSPIIKVQEGKTYTISGRTDTTGIVGIDAAGNRVKVNSNTNYALSANNGSFVVPNGVVAVQFTLVLNHALTSEDEIQLEEGAVATAYEEYRRIPINEAVLDIHSEVSALQTEVDKEVYDIANQLHIEIKGNVILKWQLGSIGKNAGGETIYDVDSDTRIRTPKITCVDNYSLVISCNSGYEFLYLQSSSQDNQWRTGSISVNIEQGDNFRIALRQNPAVDYSSYTQEQIDGVAELSGIKVIVNNSINQILESQTAQIESQTSQISDLNNACSGYEDITDAYQNTQNAWINKNNGQINSSSIQTVNTYTVTYGEIYKVTASPYGSDASAVNYYTENSFYGYEHDMVNGSYTKEITIPFGVTIMRVCGLTNSIIQVCKKSIKRDLAEIVQNLEKNPNLKVLNGKEIVILGDSSCDKNYTNWAKFLYDNASKYGVTVIAKAKTSTGWNVIGQATDTVQVQWNSAKQELTSNEPIIIITTGGNELAQLQATYSETLLLCKSDTSAMANSKEIAVQTMKNIFADKPAANVFLVSNFYAGSSDSKDDMRRVYREFLTGMCDYFSCSLIDLTRNSQIRGYLEVDQSSSGYHLHTTDGMHAYNEIGYKKLFRIIMGNILLDYLFT